MWVSSVSDYSLLDSAHTQNTDLRNGYTYPLYPSCESEKAFLTCTYSDMHNLSLRIWQTKIWWSAENCASRQAQDSDKASLSTWVPPSSLIGPFHPPFFTSINLSPLECLERWPLRYQKVYDAPWLLNPRLAVIGWLPVGIWSSLEVGYNHQILI